ncbi:putative s-phase kinase-associated protein 1a [Diplodia seriata]|uniref:Putative s-phase kinase-associated protein 1a n=1 Tax=Diplodia seriata TaxID=420778 RepID=A0A0G2GCR7_9PEZI|nr:putative s-phase kinase-associated protein 1a [Diplodia seriata]
MVTHLSTNRPVRSLINMHCHRTFIMSMMKNDYIALKANNGVVIDVNAQILRTILEWCEHHKNDDTSRKIDYIRTPFYALPPIDKWDQDFMSGADIDTLFEITATAHFLDIPALHDLGCRTIASTIAGKSPREVRDMLGTHDIPIGEEEDEPKPENTTDRQLPPWNAAKRLFISPLVQLAEFITGGGGGDQPLPRSSSSAEFPPLTPSDLPASYAHRTTWSDFTWVRVHLYHFSTPRSNIYLFGAGVGIHLRVAALGCHPWVVARRGERRRYCCSAAADDDDDLPTTTTATTSSSSRGSGRMRRTTSSIAGLYLSTEPLPLPTLDHQLWLPIAHRVVFQHEYRENKVGAAAIEIEYEFPPPGSTRNDGSPL